MILWRVSNHASLDGGGGLAASGRWHTFGRRIVYCAPNPAAALLEVLVHAELSVDSLPVSFRHLEIEASDATASEQVDLAALGPGWQGRPAVTRRTGDEWLRSGRSALLHVPSVIVPETWNVLVNPQHPDSSQLRIVRVHRQGVDPRLVR